MTPQSRPPSTPSEKDLQFGMDVESIRRTFIRNLFCHRGKFPEVALPNDNYLALAYTVRDRIMQKWNLLGPHLFRKGVAHGGVLVGRIPHRSATGSESA